MGYFHMGVATRYYRMMAGNHWDEWADAFTDEKTGKPATKEQVFEWLDELDKKGYTCVPTCDNIKKDGSCAGHKGKASTKK